MNSNFRNLFIISILFFLFGFITNLNDILIPHLKRACELSDFQSAFVQFAFFGAYFLVSIPAARIIRFTGYKNGIVIGLIICAIGALIFIPAANTRTYQLFLLGLSVLASGITLLQVAANPYVSLLGSADKASSRLSLMGGLNSLGASLAPFAGGILILSAVEYSVSQLALLPENEKTSYLNTQAGMVVLPYTILAFCLFALAALIFFAKLPLIQAEAKTEEQNSDFSIRQYPELYYGIIAIFCYVGAEVCIGSFIIRYGQGLKIEGFTEQMGSRFVSIYMVGAMIFRFIGISLLGKVAPLKALLTSSVLAFILLLVSISTQGYLALSCAVLVGACNSIMWPVIFPNSIENLGIHSSKGSSYLIMAVVGGAIIPLLMGYFSDKIGIQKAFIVPALCYIFIGYYAFKFTKWGKPMNS